MRLKMAEFQTTNNRLPTEGEKARLAYVVFQVMRTELLASGVVEPQE